VQAQVGCDPVVVDQRVVDVEQKDKVGSHGWGKVMEVRRPSLRSG